MSCSFLFSYSAKDTDIIDEAIYYFKANVFFKNYEIKVSGECLQEVYESLKNVPACLNTNS